MSVIDLARRISATPEGISVGGATLRRTRAPSALQKQMIRFDRATRLCSDVAANRHGQPLRCGLWLGGW
jgi:hypothetical protein